MYVYNAISRMVDKEKDIEKVVTGVEKAKINRKIKLLTSGAAFTRSGAVSDTLLLGIGAEYAGIKFDEYDSIYFVEVEEIEDCVVKQDSNLLLVGDNGRKIGMPLDAVKKTIITRMGPFTLCCLAREKFATVNWNHNSMYGVRKFMVKGTNLPIVKIPSVVFTKMLSRAMIEDIKISDLLAYCRSIASTIVYTTSGMYTKYKINTDELVMFCVVIKNISLRHRRYYEKVHNILQINNSEGVEMVGELMKSKLLSMLYELVADTGVVEYLKELTKVKSQEKEETILTKLFNSMSDKDVVELSTSNKLIIHNSDYDESYEEDSSDDDDDPVDKDDEEKSESSDSGSDFDDCAYDTDSESSDDRKDGDDDDEEWSKNLTVVGQKKTKLSTIREVNEKGGVEESKQIELNSGEFEEVKSVGEIEKFENKVEVSKHNFVARFIQQWYMYRAVRKGLVKHENCDICPKITIQQVNGINNQTRKYFLRFVRFLDANQDKIMNWTVVRGTALAALRYGKLAVKLGRTVNYVDSDVDVVVYVKSSTSVEQFIKKMIKEMGSLINWWRGAKDTNSAICLMQWKSKFKSIDLGKFEKVHEITPTDRLLNSISIDVGVVQVIENTVLINDKEILEQTGLAYGRHMWDRIKPVNMAKSPLTLYGIDIPVMKYLSIMFHTTAHEYENGNYKNLWYPNWKAIEVAAYAYCDNIVMSEKSKIRFDMLTRLLGKYKNKILFENMHDINTKIKLAIAIVFTGSRGDFEPLLSVLANLSDNANVTVYKPTDVMVDTHFKCINYIATYKNLVHGNGDKKVLKHMAECMKTMHGTFDYVVGTHFSHEIGLLKAVIQYIRIHPLIQPWSRNPLELLASSTGLVHSHANDKNTTRVCAIPIKVENTQFKNIGWPLRPNIKQPTQVDLQLEYNCDGVEKSYTLITFGSMGMNSMIELIQSILDDAKGMVIWVRGYTTIDKMMRYEGKMYRSTNKAITKQLSIVSEINYHYMAKYIKKVHCHGGAGTMFNFWYNNVPMSIRPQAYDQKFNATWYANSTANDDEDYEKELQTFNKNLKELGLPTKTVRMSENRTHIELINTKHLKRGDDVYKFTCDYIVHDQVLTRSNCVEVCLKTLYKGKLGQRALTAYEKLTNMRTITSLEDIIALLMLAKVPICVFDGMNSVLYMSESYRGDLAMQITKDKTHANIIKFKNVEPLKLKLKTVNVMTEITNLSIIRLMNSFTQIMGKIRMSETTITDNQKQQLQVISRKDINDRWLVVMRQNELIQMHQQTEAGEGFAVIKRLHPWCVYACSTVKGMMYGLSIPIKGDRCGLYTGSNCKLDVNFTLKINQLQDVDISRKLTPMVQAKITAINQTTKKKCEEIGLLVTTVGAENFESLYVYNTFNRKHHKEQERELIVKAKKLLIPGKQTTEMQIKQLKKMRNPRTILLSGLIRHAIEPLPTDKHTINALSVIKNGKWYQEDKLWYTNDSDSFSQLQKLFKLVESDEWERHELVNATREGTENITTLKELLSTFKEEIQDSEQIVLDKHDVVETTNIRRVFDIQFSLKDWVETKASGLIMKWPFVLIAQGMCVFEIMVKGAGEIDGLKRWNNFEQDFKQNYLDNKFSMKEIKDEQIESNELPELSALSPSVTAEAWGTIDSAPELLFTNKITEVVESSQGVIELNEKFIDDVKNVKTMDYWDNFNQLADNVIYLPQTPGFKVKSRVEPTKLSISSKLRNEEYPDYARPSMTNVFGQELASVTTRHGSVKSYVKKNLNTKDELSLFTKNYFKKDFKQMSKNYSTLPIGINRERTLKWVKQHNYPKSVTANLKELFDVGFEMEGVSEIRVHGKIEQTTRMEKFSRWFTEVQTRSIMASAYCISALFSPMFLELKKRFKDSLRSKVVYSDGMSPDQLAAHMRKHRGVKWIIEDDLSKQDAATTHLIINIEFLVYENLGASLLDLQLYKWIHCRWRFRGNGFSGVWDAMRLTGQPTTSLGNAITNLIVHNRFYRRNELSIICMYILGDDNIILSNQKLNVKNHGTETKEFYNIVSKVSQKCDVGQYLAMVVHVKDDIVKLCPDFKRLRHRYAVCNYVFTEADRKEKLQQRKLSYCLMLGNIKSSIEFVKEHFPTTNVLDWYDIQDAISGNASYYNVDVIEIENDIAALCSTIKSDTYYIADMPHFQHATRQSKNTIMLDKLRNNLQYICSLNQPI